MTLRGPRRQTKPGEGNVRDLHAGDLPALRALLDRDPAVNLFVRHRAEVTGLDSRFMLGPMWGYFEHGELVSVCHTGANIVPAEATQVALRRFSERLKAEQPQPASIVGLQEDVQFMWSLLEERWGPGRSLRLDQPFLSFEGEVSVPGDARVRPVALDEFEVLYPACVQMFIEEVGVDPEIGNRMGYRSRVSQLIAQGWAFAIIEDGEVLFKAEIGLSVGGICQVQGVFVKPELRGLGLGTSALASVIRLAQATIAPVVTLYVNDHNAPARRSYAKLGFRQTATFASILL